MNTQADVAWMFQVGDPTFGAWLVTIGYMIACGLCTGIFFYQREIGMVIGKPCSIPRLNSRSFWLACALFSLLLGLNKQLDLQTLLIELIRQNSGNGSVKDAQQIGKTSFILLIIAIFGYTYIVFSSISNKSRLEIRLGLASVALMLIYVIYRASVIHQSHDAIQSGSFMDRLLLTTEPAGVLVLIFAASCSLKQARLSFF